MKRCDTTNRLRMTEEEDCVKGNMDTKLTGHNILTEGALHPFAHSWGLRVQFPLLIIALDHIRAVITTLLAILKKPC